MTDWTPQDQPAPPEKKPVTFTKRQAMRRVGLDNKKLDGYGDADRINKAVKAAGWSIEDEIAEIVSIIKSLPIVTEKDIKEKALKIRGLKMRAIEYLNRLRCDASGAKPQKRKDAKTRVGEAPPVSLTPQVAQNMEQIFGKETDGEQSDTDLSCAG